jgi:hypothetical protein
VELRASYRVDDIITPTNFNLPLCGIDYTGVESLPNKLMDELGSAALPLIIGKVYWAEA